MVGRDFSHDQPFLVVIPNNLLAFNLPLLAPQTQLLAKGNFIYSFPFKHRNYYPQVLELQVYFPKSG